MSSSRHPILVAPKKALDYLQKCGKMPADFLLRLSDMELHELVRLGPDKASSEDEILSRYLGLDREVIESKSSPIKERFLSMMAGRDLVSLHIIEPGFVSETLQAHNKLIASLASIGQDDQAIETQWTLVFIVKGDFTNEDKFALRKIAEKMQGGLPLKLYIMSGKLRTDEEGRFVEAKYVWELALTPLLTRLCMQRVSPEHRGVFIWRAVVLEPDMAVLPVLETYHNWLETQVFNSSDQFTTPPFELSPVDATFKGAGKKKKLRFEGPYEKPKQFEVGIEKELAPREMSLIRAKASTSLREKILRQSNGVDSEVRSGEESTWRQAHHTPSIIGSMGKGLSNSLSNEQQKIDSDENHWEALLRQIEIADRAREKAIRIAKVIDDARSHFIGWGTRTIMLFVSSLLVFYLVFVMLYPVFERGGIDKLTYWLACTIGILGALSAMLLSWYLELSCGQRGVRKLVSAIDNAKEKNATKACLKFIAATKENNQRRSWVDMLDSTITLSKRLQKIVSFVTREEREAVEEEPADYEQVRVIDSSTFARGTRLSIGDMSSDMSKAFSREILIENGESLRNDLTYAWNVLSNQSDTFERGSFPVEYVRRYWGQAISCTWADFYRLVVDRAVDDWRKREAKSLFTICDKLVELQGLSPASRPFLSSRCVSNEDRKFSSQLLYVRDSQMCNLIEETLNRESFQNLTSVVSPNLPYFGMFFEEMPLAVEVQAVSR